MNRGHALMKFRSGLLGLLAACAMANPALAQGAVVPFGGIAHDNTLPVEMSADTLSIDQAAGTAEFTGNVAVGQGTLRLVADRMMVKYVSENGAATGSIESITAEGHVLLTNGAEAAEGTSAVYIVATGIVTMAGDVLLTQGKNALSGQSLRIDLVAGTAFVEGRVQTIFQPAANP